MKGLEAGTGKRLTTLVEEELPQARAAVWLGPGHVQEFTAGIPNCMVIDSKGRGPERGAGGCLLQRVDSLLLRPGPHWQRDWRSSKNVIGIAAGMLDGPGAFPP